MRAMQKTPPASASVGRKKAKVSLRLGGGWREAMEAYGEAVAMAEAGEAGTAREILGELRAERRKILVLAEEGVLPDALASYSLSLAERLGFDIVLLSVFSAPPTRNSVRAAARPLMEEAARRGVTCAQLVRRGRPEAVLNAVSMELRRVEFVLTRRPEAERRFSALLVPEFALKC